LNHIHLPILCEWSDNVEWGYYLLYIVA
jgi:hypothetical protein